MLWRRNWAVSWAFRLLYRGIGVGPHGFGLLRERSGAFRGNVWVDRPSMGWHGVENVGWGLGVAALVRTAAGWPRCSDSGRSASSVGRLAGGSALRTAVGVPRCPSGVQRAAPSGRIPPAGSKPRAGPAATGRDRSRIGVVHQDPSMRAPIAKPSACLHRPAVRRGLHRPGLRRMQMTGYWAFGGSSGYDGWGGGAGGGTLGERVV